jgi:hypothetical protein
VQASGMLAGQGRSRPSLGDDAAVVPPHERWEERRWSAAERSSGRSCRINQRRHIAPRWWLGDESACVRCVGCSTETDQPCPLCHAASGGTPRGCTRKRAGRAGFRETARGAARLASAPRHERSPMPPRVQPRLVGPVLRRGDRDRCRLNAPGRSALQRRGGGVCAGVAGAVLSVRYWRRPHRTSTRWRGSSMTRSRSTCAAGRAN